MNTHKNLVKLQHVIQHRNWPEALVIVQKLIDNQPNKPPVTPEELEIQGYIEGQDKQIMWLKSRIAGLEKEKETLTLELNAQYKTVESSYSKNEGLQSQIEAKDKEIQFLRNGTDGNRRLGHSVLKQQAQEIQEKDQEIAKLRKELQGWQESYKYSD